MVEIDKIIDIVQLLVVIVAMVLLYQSVPAAKVAQLLDKVDAEAKKTETPIDDILAGVARLIFDMQQNNSTAGVTDEEVAVQGEATDSVI